MKPRSSDKSFKCIFTILVLKEKQQRQTFWGFQRYHQGSLWPGCKTMSWLSAQKWDPSGLSHKTQESTELNFPNIFAHWWVMPTFPLGVGASSLSPLICYVYRVHKEVLADGHSYWAFTSWLLPPIKHLLPWPALVYFCLLVFVWGSLCSGHFANV